VRIAIACLAAFSVVFIGCGGSTPAAEPPSGAAPEPPSAAEPPATSEPTPATPPASDGAGREKMTAKQCEANGGSVVGDIGDGATQRPDYVCASGDAPRGNIVAEPGGPIAIEGAVCCPK
jgi:hypothetical protein